MEECGLDSSTVRWVRTVCTEVTLSNRLVGACRIYRRLPQVLPLPHEPG